MRCLTNWTAEPAAAPRCEPYFIAVSRRHDAGSPSSSGSTRACESPASIDTGDSHALIVPELLGEPASWRLETAMKYGSHRGAAAGSAVQFVKQRLLMPVLRWLFEYSRDNFERQRRVNQVLFACVQELALETARLRRELEQRRS